MINKALEQIKANEAYVKKGPVQLNNEILSNYDSDIGSVRGTVMPDDEMLNRGPHSINGSNRNTAIN